MRRYIILLTLLAVAGIVSAEPYTEPQKEASQMVEKRKYEIEVTMAQPSGWKSVALSSGYSLRIDEDKIICNLPYFGRADNIPYGGGEGLVFSSTVTDYKVEQGKRGSERITFTTRSRDGFNTFMLDIWDNGASTIMVIPAGRRAISYVGEIKTE